MKEILQKELKVEVIEEISIVTSEYLSPLHDFLFIKDKLISFYMTSVIFSDENPDKTILSIGFFFFELLMLWLASFTFQWSVYNMVLALAYYEVFIKQYIFLAEFFFYPFVTKATI